MKKQEIRDKEQESFKIQVINSIQVLLSAGLQSGE